ncbi:type I-E CRISPR-associated protein Cas7/Cse4/CasC [Streptomyces sp. NPDC059650]|uniref:type I-E CRISPR-associated protein Cas7/Cse4/CasC n=1 Tax=Streptomyces sp. NPDC059650 TaxID=3346896 RepID=UPI00368836B4
MHVLQTVPPANVNRGADGAPKAAFYGGARRPRVSSQAWKRSTRIAFALLGVDPQLLGTRTAAVAEHLAEAIAQRTSLDADKASRLAVALISKLGVSGKKEKSGGKKDEAEATEEKAKSEATAYLLFYGVRQIDNIVDLIADRAEELAGLSDAKLAAELKGTDVQAAIRDGHPIDVALFGRMIADNKGLSVDAACQVAHALATHAAEEEEDYYVAIDDRRPKEESGAGMIGRIGFNSATLYRYAAVSLHQLEENLADTKTAIEAVTAFVNGFVRSMPTGYINAFAHQTMPQLVAITVRDTQPVNLVTAFEKPVTAFAGSGYAEPSARALATEHTTIRDLWGVQALWSGITHGFTDQKTRDQLDGAFGTAVPFPALVGALAAELAK